LGLEFICNTPPHKGAVIVSGFTIPFAIIQLNITDHKS
jgi:hypothetical protein